MAEPNEYRIKFKRKLSIGEPLNISKSYRIALDVEITSGSKIDNQDGSYSYEFGAEIKTGEVLKETGEVLKAKDNSTESQQLRTAIWKCNEDYSEIMSFIRNNIEDIINKYHQSK